MSIKKLLALLLCILLLASAGCGQSGSGSINLDDVVISGSEGSAPASAANSAVDGQAVYATDGDVSYPAALYLLFMQDAFREVQDASDLAYAEVPAAAFSLSDGTSTSGGSYIFSHADEEFRWLYLVERLCRENGIRPEDSSYHAQAVYYADEIYKRSAKYYDFLNITVADLQQYYLYSYLYNDLFYARYGVGGEKEIPESALEALMEQGAYRLQYAYFPYYDAETKQALPAEEIAERRSLAQDCLRRFRAGEHFEDLVYESYLMLDPNTVRTAETTYDYYVAKQGGSLPQELMDAAAALADNDAQLVEAEDYAAVVLRLPVNGAHSAPWRRAALQLAYGASYGAEFTAEMTALYDSTAPAYNAELRAMLTPATYVQLLDAYYAK